MGPWSPIVVLLCPRTFLAGGRSARSGRWPSRVCITCKPADRHAASSFRFGSMVRRNLETSFPSISPNPPGSRKSRCMSMMRSAQCAGSNSNSYGSASTLRVRLICVGKTCSGKTRIKTGDFAAGTLTGVPVYFQINSEGCLSKVSRRRRAALPQGLPGRSVFPICPRLWRESLLQRR
jgi:hypothetical protein